MLINLLVLKAINFQSMYLNLKEVFYGLKQAFRSWYEKLNKLLIFKKKSNMGKFDLKLFIKYKNHDLIIIQIYDDILFDGTNNLHAKNLNIICIGNLR